MVNTIGSQVKPGVNIEGETRERATPGRAVRTCRPVRRFVAALSCEKYQKIMPRTHFSPPENSDNSLFSLYL